MSRKRSGRIKIKSPSSKYRRENDPKRSEYWVNQGWTLHKGTDGPNVLTSPDGDSQLTVHDDGTVYDHDA